MSWYIKKCKVSKFGYFRNIHAKKFNIGKTATNFLSLPTSQLICIEKLSKLVCKCKKIRTTQYMALRGKWQFFNRSSIQDSQKLHEKCEHVVIEKQAIFSRIRNWWISKVAFTDIVKTWRLASARGSLPAALAVKLETRLGSSPQHKSEKGKREKCIAQHNASVWLQLTSHNVAYLCVTLQSYRIDVTTQM